MTCNQCVQKILVVLSDTIFNLPPTCRAHNMVPYQNFLKIHLEKSGYLILLYEQQHLLNVIFVIYYFLMSISSSFFYAYNLFILFYFFQVTKRPLTAGTIFKNSMVALVKNLGTKVKIFLYLKKKVQCGFQKALFEFFSMLLRNVIK